MAAAPAPVLRVAIAGGGVGGFTTALTLLKAGHDVTIYEKTQAFARFGGPIQFASNALSTLKAIDEKLFARVMDAFGFALDCAMLPGDGWSHAHDGPLCHVAAAARGGGGCRPCGL